MEDVIVKKKLFGSEITFIIYNSEENIAKELIEESYEEGLRLQRIFNLYDKRSFLSLLNKKRKMKMPKEFIEVLKMALSMCKETEGLYDISLGKQFIERKSGKEISKINCSYKEICITDEIVELKNEDIIIDFGSIAKGYITDKMAEFLTKNGILSGLIDSRGDIRVFGDLEREIAIQHPRYRDKLIGNIKIKSSGIATSGDYNQYNKNFDESHIINKKDCISVSVIASNLTEADLYATAIMVLDKEKVKYLLKKNKNVSALCIDKDLNITKYNNFPRVIK